MDVYGALAAFEVHAPHHVEEAVAGEELAPVQRQKAQEIVFTRGERQEASFGVANAAPGKVEGQVSDLKSLSALNVTLTEGQAREAGQQLGGRVGGQQEIVGVGGPVRLGQVLRGKQGQTGRDRRIVAPSMLDQAGGMAQGQAVGGRREVRQQDIRGTAPEGPAEAFDGSRAAVQRVLSDGIARFAQDENQALRVTVLAVWGEYKNIEHSVTGFQVSSAAML